MVHVNAEQRVRYHLRSQLFFFKAERVMVAFQLGN